MTVCPRSWTWLSSWWSSASSLTGVRGMDPRIRIHTKMSWIRNPGSNIKYVHMWQVNDDGLSSLLDVAELLGVRGLKSDRRPETSKARKPHVRHL